MARKGKDSVGISTPSRTRSTKNSNQGRDEALPTNRFDHHIHYDRWKNMENGKIVHEWIISLDGVEENLVRERVFGLGWGFMYKTLVRINVSMVREFCANLSSGEQDHMFLRGKRIPFTKDAIRRHLGIRGDLPDAGVDDDYVALTKAYERGDYMDMAEIFQASAWHKIIMANIDHKTHGTNFDMNHALLIYVLMTQGLVNLPRIMRDILLVRPTKHPRHLLPYPILRHLERHERLLRSQGRQITNTQLMIRHAFPDAVFDGLVSDDSNGSTEAES
ncbi:hypothetical protein PIB30_070602 [Stylosanthes scabra]|uniref:Putative plant transposon protein domain-containing protein n=1 Tax=Stylosanthes scabra TaxID=79078 RepID=A0ABU6RNH7_9FABA|nr:hypothetical protein [Stylosanthes scabra]